MRLDLGVVDAGSGVTTFDDGVAYAGTRIHGRARARRTDASRNARRSFTPGVPRCLAEVENSRGYRAAARLAQGLAYKLRRQRVRQEPRERAKEQTKEQE